MLLGCWDTGLAAAHCRDQIKTQPRNLVIIPLRHIHKSKAEKVNSATIAIRTLTNSSEIYCWRATVLQCYGATVLQCHSGAVLHYRRSLYICARPFRTELSRPAVVRPALCRVHSFAPQFVAILFRYLRAAGGKVPSLRTAVDETPLSTTPRTALK